MVDSERQTTNRKKIMNTKKIIVALPELRKLIKKLQTKAKRIRLLEEALLLCAPLTKRAQAARSVALDPDLQSL
jgi:hypothetical protein